MNQLKRPQSELKFEHSPRITERRRALFPMADKESDIDSDLGHISPLSSDPNSDEETSLSRIASPTHSKRLADLISKQVICTPSNRTVSCSETMSPLYLSPFTSEITAYSFYSKKDTTTSPTQTLKTPQETATNHKVPKLMRKSLLDSINGECGGGGSKRKLSPLNTPEQKVAKLDAKSSKVRTALFTDAGGVLTPKHFHPRAKMNKSETKVSPVVRRLSQGSRGKKRYGQINAGVMHKIKKPKKKKAGKSSVAKPVETSFENDDVLNEYLADLKAIENRTSLIENKENVPEVKKVETADSDLVEKCKKRPASPTSESNPKKKFFRSRDSISAALNPVNTVQLVENKIVLEATNSVSYGDNSIVLHSAPNLRTNEIKCQDGQMMLSPTSQMCDMASGLAINSPKKVRNLTAILENMPNANVFNQISTVSPGEPANKKMYPIFYPEYQKKLTEEMKSSGKSRGNVHVVEKKFLTSSPNQMMLDAGQKRFGLVQCKECEFMYHIGDPNDEILHLNYHRSRNIFKFPGWKNERVLETIDTNGRILHILPGDSMYWWKKVKDVLYVIDRELGFFNLEHDLNTAQGFLYVKNRTIVGCLIAVSRTEAYPLISSQEGGVDMCSNKATPIKCGVSRVWVSPNYRHQNIASSLMNSLKRHFICGTVLSNCDIALSAPTDMGKRFAKKYFNTDNFLIFCE